MVNITVNVGVFNIEYTQEELNEEISDYLFLKDAFLVLLNEEVAKDSDLPFDRDEVIRLSKGLFVNTGYSNEFIEKIYNLPIKTTDYD